MIYAVPHFLLFAEASLSEDSGMGRWEFVLDRVGSKERHEVSDSEPGVGEERLQLLTVVRGLEALDQISRVTLLTTSQYVNRGIRRGISKWRENNWRWEEHGQVTRVKNDDLWQRLDRAMDLHDVSCRSWQVAKLESSGVQEELLDLAGTDDSAIENDGLSTGMRTASIMKTAFQTSESPESSATLAAFDELPAFDETAADETFGEDSRGFEATDNWPLNESNSMPLRKAFTFSDFKPRVERIKKIVRSVDKKLRAVKCFIL